MQPYLLLADILLPIVSGTVIYFLKLRNYRSLCSVTFSVTLLVSVLTWLLMFFCPEEPFTVISFTADLTFTLRLDGTGKIFCGLVSVLWPLTVLYAFPYMEGKKHLSMFFGLFTATYGITLGIAMSGGIFTMYCFYELLTLSTVPLVIQPMNRKASSAAFVYFLFSLGGAAFAFVSMMFLISHGGTGLFTPGWLGTDGMFTGGAAQLFWFFGFIGFGVKAAIFPLHFWLPRASVAPTPVTALLHAVAVVKAGAFAVIRLTYFCYGVPALSGSWAHTAALLICAFTVVFGSARAVRETDWKRRLAYSTVANMSYILLGVVLMTPEGLSAGMLHMLFHAVIKILAFFCAGAVLTRTGRTGIYEMNGLGRKMPVTFACFTVSALALTGIPPFCGFVSKWYLLKAMAASGSAEAWAGAAAIIISAVLTAIYMFTVVRRAWFPSKNADLSGLEGVREADWKMCVPNVLLAASALALGLFAGPVLDMIGRIVSAVF